MSEDYVAGGAAGGAIPVHRFDASAYPAEARHRAYQDLVAFAFRVTDPEPDFMALVDTYRLDRMVVHHSDVGAQTFDRSLEQIRRDGMSHFALQAVISGEVDGDFGGRPMRARAGEVFLADLRRPFRMRTSRVKVVTLGLGRELLDPLGPAGTDLHGHVVRGAAGELLTEYLRVMAERLPRLTADALPGLTRATFSLIETCLTGAGRPSGPAGELESLTLERARRFIQANLGSRELGPDAVATALKLSRSALYRLFAPLGGVSQYVWSQRLDRARALLSAAGAVPRMSELAFGLGFGSEAHFSRAFRKAYGVSPSEYAAEQRDVGTAAPRDSFAPWVKDLS